MLNGHGGGGHGHGHGHGHHGSVHIHNQNHGGLFGDVDICPEIVLAGVSALGAAGLLAIYIAATQNANGKRKRRRRIDDYSPLPAFDYVGPLIVAGKES